MLKQPQSVLIIYYAGAKKGKFEEFLPHIKKRLSLRYPIIDVLAGHEQHDSENFAYENAHNYDIIISCGGDGTLHQVVNGIAKSGASPIIGILPYGTCNDVANSLKIPKELDKAIDCILRLNTINYDLMYNGSEYIVYSLASGYVAPVSFSASNKLKKKLGRFAYFLQSIKYLLKAKSMPMTITYDGNTFDGKTPFVLLANSRYVGGFNFNINEDLSNKKYKLIIFKGGTFSNFFRLAKLFLSGVEKLKKSKSVIIQDVSEVTIKNHSDAVFAIDGEKCEFLKKVITIPKTITFISA